MRGPAVAQVTCPSCGAPIRVDVWSQVHTCRFCGQSSFVHRPRQPVMPPPPGREHYGHIHVPQKAVNKSMLVLFLFAFFGVDLVIGLVIALVFVGGAVSTTVSTRRSTPPSVTVSQPSINVIPIQPNSGVPLPVPAAGPSCQKAIRCCKAMQPDNAACDGLAFLGEANCAGQVKQLEDAAKSMGRRCD